jgi:hypothetical protein
MLKRSLDVSLKTMSVLGMRISQEMDTSLVSSLLSRVDKNQREWSKHL